LTTDALLRSSEIERPGIERRLPTARADRGAPRSCVRRRRRVRDVLGTVVAIIAILGLSAGVVGVWARRALFDSDGFARHAAQVIREPAVQREVAAALTDEAMQLVDAQATLRRALPDEGALFAAPLAFAASIAVRQAVDELVASDMFADLWVSAATVAQRSALQALDGDGGLVRERNGDLTINLLPALTTVLAQVTAVPGLLDRSTIPRLAADELPAAARERLEDAFGVDLRDDFGQFTLHDQGGFVALQRSVRIVDPMVDWLLPAGVALAALALWVSVRRRRTLLVLCCGVAAGMLAIRLLAVEVQDLVAGVARSPGAQAAAGAATARFVEPLRDAAAWTLCGAAVLGAVAVSSAGYPWIVAVRRGIGRAVRPGR
jgi:hypothetical protein